MSFTATLSGHVTADNTEAGNDKARLVEQAISDAINAIVEEANAEGIVIHTTTFTGEWVQDVQTPAADADHAAATAADETEPAEPAAGDTAADDAAASAPTAAPAEADPLASDPPAEAAAPSA